MRYALLNLVACPMCKHFPLELYVFETREDVKTYNVSKPFCDFYCGYLRKNVRDLEEEPPCEECLKKEIAAGVLYCPHCGRWYPIINGIPLMYPDDKRKHPRVAKREKEFILKYKDMFPEKLRSKITF